MAEDWQRDHDERRRAHIESMGPPFYGLVPALQAPGFLQGWGGSNEDQHVSITHRWSDGERVVVETATSTECSEQHLLTQWFIARTGSAEPIEFPVRTVADRWTRVFAVDRAEVEFVVIGDEAVWIAVGVVGARRVEIHAKGVPQDVVALATIDVSLSGPASTT